MHRADGAKVVQGQGGALASQQLVNPKYEKHYFPFTHRCHVDIRQQGYPDIRTDYPN